MSVSDFTLAVGEVTEVVEVSGAAIALKTEEASVATTIVKEQLVQLPLVGRQIIGATLLAPGAYFVNNNSKASTRLRFRASERSFTQCQWTHGSFEQVLLRRNRRDEL
jgi:hypothetical protein